MPANRASLREALGVRPASELGRQPGEAALPVAGDLSSLLPRGLPRGSTVTATTRGGPGLTSLMLALLAGPSADGRWCAVVDEPRLLPAAAVQAGIAPERLALIPDSHGLWDKVVATLVEGLTMVAVRLVAPVSRRLAANLSARARAAGAVLVPYGLGAAAWPGVDLGLRVTAARWNGLSRGAGRVRCLELQVEARGPGAPRRGVVRPFCFCRTPHHDAAAAPVIDLDARRLPRRAEPCGS